MNLNKHFDVKALKDEIINLVKENDGMIEITPRREKILSKSFKKLYYEDKSIVAQKLNTINKKIDMILHYIDICEND